MPSAMSQPSSSSSSHGDGDVDADSLSTAVSEAIFYVLAQEAKRATVKKADMIKAVNAAGQGKKEWQVSHEIRLSDGRLKERYVTNIAAIYSSMG